MYKRLDVSMSLEMYLLFKNSSVGAKKSLDPFGQVIQHFPVVKHKNPLSFQQKPPEVTV